MQTQSANASGLSPAPATAAAGQVRAVRGAAERRKSYTFGVKAEAAVARMLHSQGYIVLSQRERNQGGEIDLIVARDDVVAFIEVKARRRGFDGLEAVDRRKRRRMTRASEAWLSDNPGFAGHSLRFDIALVWPTGLPEHIENAFEAEPQDDFVF